MANLPHSGHFYNTGQIAENLPCLLDNLDIHIKQEAVDIIIFYIYVL